jgi:hypothetical protein
MMAMEVNHGRELVSQFVVMFDDAGRAGKVG